MTSKDENKRPMIEAVGLSKFYGPFAAARDVTFSVHEGELVAFLGPNGAGKSTTMKMLTGYIAPSEGHGCIAGHNMMEDRIAGSRRLGYLARERSALSGDDPRGDAQLLCRRPRADAGQEKGTHRRGRRHL